MTKTYDSKCLELAEYFLSDQPHLATARRAEELALLIQTAIEDYIRNEDACYAPPQGCDRGVVG